MRKAWSKLHIFYRRWGYTRGATPIIKGKKTALGSIFYLSTAERIKRHSPKRSGFFMRKRPNS